jgi:hypothetical protein
MTTENITPKIVMIDIETLDSLDTAVILQIAVSVYDGESKPTLISWDIDTNQRGRTISAETVKWWLEQIKNGCESPFDGTHRVSLYTALDKLYEHIQGATEVWSEGSFDIRILSDAYDSLGTDHSFRNIHYRAFRDLRTAKYLIPADVYRTKLKVDPISPHNAADDCFSQMLTLINIKNYINQISE